MRLRCGLIVVVGVSGCSTAPVAGLLDAVSPSRARLAKEDRRDTLPLLGDLPTRPESRVPPPAFDEPR